MLCWSKESSAPSPEPASAARTRASRYSCSLRKLMRSSKSTCVWPGACSGRFQLWCGSMSSGLTMLGSIVFLALAIDILLRDIPSNSKYAMGYNAGTRFSRVAYNLRHVADSFAHGVRARIALVARRLAEFCRDRSGNLVLGAREAVRSAQRGREEFRRIGGVGIPAHALRL